MAFLKIASRKQTGYWTEFVFGFTVSVAPVFEPAVGGVPAVPGVVVVLEPVLASSPGCIGGTESPTLFVAGRCSLVTEPDSPVDPAGGAFISGTDSVTASVGPFLAGSIFCGSAANAEPVMTIAAAAAIKSVFIGCSPSRFLTTDQRPVASAVPIGSPQHRFSRPRSPHFLLHTNSVCAATAMHALPGTHDLVTMAEQSRVPGVSRTEVVFLERDVMIEFSDVSSAPGRPRNPDDPTGIPDDLPTNPDTPIPLPDESGDDTDIPMPTPEPQPMIDPTQIPKEPPQYV